MNRSKSLCINRFTQQGSLTRSQSLPSLDSVSRLSVDAKHYIKIKEVNPKEAFNELVLIERNIHNYDHGVDAIGQLDEEQGKWYDRYDQAFNISSSILFQIKYCLQKMETNTTRELKTFFFVAYFRFVPIGALMLSLEEESEIPEVSLLATHPGIRGCGILLIEEAVKRSQQLGIAGKLRLYALAGAEPAYIKMGFVLSASGDMKLNPAETSNKWKWSEKEQCYKFLYC